MFNLIANFFKSESEASFISILLMVSEAVDTGEFKLLGLALGSTVGVVVFAQELMAIKLAMIPDKDRKRK
ncbi:hypothetical protein CYANOKiyG1_79820 [Okeania sp. KiyG1]|nr:hypothetical protein CYANOKiyG1_79820 [Okeania sp. KiyG1]